MNDQDPVSNFLTFGEGGGGFIGEGKKVRLDDLVFVVYQLKRRDGTLVGDGPSVFCHVLGTILDPDNDDPQRQKFDQYYPIGAKDALQHYAPSTDAGLNPAQEGPFIHFKGTKEKLWREADYAFFITPLAEMAPPPDGYVQSQGVRSWRGVVVTLTRKVVPIPQKAGQAKKDPREFLVPGTIESTPWDEGASVAAAPASAPASSTASAAGTPAPKPTAAGASPELTAKGRKYVEASLAAKSPQTKQSLGKDVFTRARTDKDPDANALAGLVMEADFLAADDAPWFFDPVSGRAASDPAHLA